MTYWRSTSQFEVDLIIGDKSVTTIQDKHLKGLRTLKEEGMIGTYLVISMDQEIRITNDDIQIFPWKVFLETLWKGKVI